VPFDDVSIAVAHRAATQPRRVRSGDLRLGHREAGADLALEQRPQPALLLLRRAELRQDLHVARVRCGAVEHDRRDLAAAHDLAKRRVLEVREARAVLLVRQEQVPQAQRLRLALELFEDRGKVVRIAGLLNLATRDGLVRVDVLRHEALELLLDQLAALGGLEVHGPLA
jgi:hypothetical protein